MSLPFPKMFFRESYKVRPGQQDSFRRTFHDAYAPLVTKLGFRAIGFWQALPLQGDATEFFALWEVDGTPEIARLARALDPFEDGDGALQSVRDELGAMVQHREGWQLLASDASLTRDDMQAQGLGRKVCLLEEVDLVTNQHALLDKALRINFCRMLKGSGFRLLGVYHGHIMTAFRALVLWELADGLDTLAWYERIVDTPEWRHWENVALTFRHGQRGTLLCAA